jgi:hypothetical protein
VLTEQEIGRAPGIPGSLVHRERARHEWRHALVARAAGFSLLAPIWVTWLEDGVDGLNGEVPGRTVEQVLASLNTEAVPERRVSLEQNAAVALAGYALQEPPDPNTSDARAAHGLLATYWCSAAVPLAVDLIRRRVRRFLTLPPIAANIEAVSETLMQRGALSGEDATAFCRSTLGAWEERMHFGTGPCPNGRVDVEQLNVGGAA